YRFLNSHGAVLSPPKPNEVGELGADAELQLSLPRLPDKPQIGYVHENVNGATIVDEVISVPIFSTETGEVISALVIGFKPLEIAAKESNAGMKSGICLPSLLHLPSISDPARKFLGDEIAHSVAQADRGRNNFRVIVDGAPQL